MKKRNQRPLTPMGIWIKTQSIVKNVELRSVARHIGIWPQNLTDKMRGIRRFSDSEIHQIENMFGESYSSSNRYI
ncbi:hypothetical protein [Clostridium minihomine]|uniref:hypothetical protein n=1 Tax=Clostridium minihomine TaxID=2045012 RepID=UPI000C7631A0|nr:hypothetical protein [Clostridium minihomine]